MTEAIMEFSVFPEWNTWKTAFSSFWPMGKYYNARNYDQMTGRFMQTDPVFAERRGFDSYDPYSYVASNPVNFTDPTGERWTWDALAKPFRIMGTNIGNGTKWVSDGFANAAKTVNNYIYGSNHNCPTLSNCAMSKIGGKNFWRGVGYLISPLARSLGIPAYLIGGLSKSRTNHIEWNEESARAYRDWSDNHLLPMVAYLILGKLCLESIVCGMIYTGISVAFFDELREEMKIVKKGPPSRGNLARKGIYGRIMSEYDYDYDGRVEMTEAIIAFYTGARRSQVDFKGDGKIDDSDIFIYALTVTNQDPQTMNMLIMLHYTLIK